MADLNNLLSAVVVLRDGGIALNATFDAITEKLSFGGASDADVLYADGLRSISINRDGEYTDVDVESLYHAIHESECVRSFIAKNFRVTLWRAIPEKSRTQPRERRAYVEKHHISGGAPLA